MDSGQRRADRAAQPGWRSRKASRRGEELQTRVEIAQGEQTERLTRVEIAQGEQGERLGRVEDLQQQILDLLRGRPAG